MAALQRLLAGVARLSSRLRGVGPLDAQVRQG